MIICFKRLTDISNFTVAKYVLLNLFWKVREVAHIPSRTSYSALWSGLFRYWGGSKREHRKNDLLKHINPFTSVVPTL